MKVYIESAFFMFMEEFFVESLQSSELVLLAFGAELKNTFAFFKEGKISFFCHGDTSLLDNLEEAERDARALLSENEKSLLLYDKHPLYNSSSLAQSLALEFGQKSFSVQHHVAHAFATAFEHGLGNFLAIVCDGTGYGEDGNIWGGEVFHNDKRIGRLEYQTLLGGDAASLDAKRVLYPLLLKCNLEEKIPLEDRSLALLWQRQIQEGFSCIESSSCGRIFDALAALLGLGSTNEYEAQLALALEAAAKKGNVDLSLLPECKIWEEDGLFVLGTCELFSFVAKHLGKMSVEDLALLSHYYVSRGLFEIARRYDSKLPLLFSGGCAYNSIMQEFFRERGVLLCRRQSPGDEQIALGQIAYYLWRKERGDFGG